MTDIAERHYENIENRRITFNRAVLITKALSQTRYLASNIRDVLVEMTGELQDANEELKKELPSKIKDVVAAVFSLVVKEKWNEAIRMIESIEQEDGIKDTLYFLIFRRKGDSLMYEKHLKAALAKEFPLAYPFAAMTYEELNKLDRAEKYYRLAFESGINYNKNLVTFYYLHGQKQKAISALDMFLERPKFVNYIRYLKPIFDAWKGAFQDLESDLAGVVEMKHPQLEFTLEQLLVHHQVDVVYRLFHSEKFGDQLMEQFRPLYFTVRMLMPDSSDYSSRIPPEIKETVNLVLTEIFRKRDFYYNRD